MSNGHSIMIKMQLMQGAYIPPKNLLLSLWNKDLG